MSENHPQIDERPLALCARLPTANALLGNNLDGMSAAFGTPVTPSNSFHFLIGALGSHSHSDRSRSAAHRFPCPHPSHLPLRFGGSFPLHPLSSLPVQLRLREPRPSLHTPKSTRFQLPTPVVGTRKHTQIFTGPISSFINI